MKRLLLGSMIAAALLLTTGCDDDNTKVDDNQTVVDTTAPVFTTGTTLSMVTGGTTTIAATDASAPITYALTVANGFTLNGSTLTAPDKAGETNVTVTARDSATTPNTATQTIAITVTVPSSGGVDTVSVNNYTWTVVTADADDNETTGTKVNFATAKAACTSMGRTLPTLTQLLATIPETSADDNSTLRTGEFMTNAPSDFALWAADSDTSSKGFGFYASGDDEGTNNRNETEKGYVVDPAGANYYTCVKATN